MIAAGGVLGVLVLFCIIFGRIELRKAIQVNTYQHEINAFADSSIGQTQVGEDGIIDSKAFVTHLPLVIIDTDGREIPNIFRFSDTGQERYYADPEITDPWVDAKITIIDNDDFKNHITDEPSVFNRGKIKLRGASSRDFEKKQYAIKLMEGEEELELPLLGMDADEDWVLSNSLLDSSCIRNYLAYNIGGTIFPYTPEVRFCEVLIKAGDSYQYQGLYLLTESVKQGEGHVEIEDFNPNVERLSYLICRDRKDHTKITLSTWASEQQLCYGWFTVKYPKEELLTDEVVHRMEEDISTIEKILYSEDMDVFLTYPKYINVDSFVDYFVFNEFMMNYDAGENSTYYYQDYARKLTMGPVWDFDNCFDNYKLAAGDAEYIVFSIRPWFERLVQDKEFVERVCRRYAELRKSVLSDEYLENFIDKTVEYLGNAAYRDRSRWGEIYKENHSLFIVTEGHGFEIDRNRYTLEGEILRLKDMQKMHGKWLDEYMADYLSEFLKEESGHQKEGAYSAMAVCFLLCFLVMNVLIIRKRNDI